MLTLSLIQFKSPLPITCVNMRPRYLKYQQNSLLAPVVSGRYLSELAVLDVPDLKVFMLHFKEFWL
jgi:hypothetical protein